MSSDETFLESFLDSLSGLPHEIKRNLELMKDLDKSCTGLTEELKQRHREYIHHAEEKVMALEVVVPPDGPPGVRATGGSGEVIIPTTEELLSWISQPGALQAIRNLEASALQLADEKVAIADQTHSLIRSIVKRLDADLENMEKILQTSGEFQAPGAAKPDDLAAIQVSQGSDWILAKVISHDPNTGMYKLSDEDVESSKSGFVLLLSLPFFFSNLQKLTTYSLL
jgi:Inhibitor of growth proteins N-terminal histone-binding